MKQLLALSLLLAACGTPDVGVSAPSRDEAALTRAPRPQDVPIYVDNVLTPFSRLQPNDARAVTVGLDLVAEKDPGSAFKCSLGSGFSPCCYGDDWACCVFIDSSGIDASCESY